MKNKHFTELLLKLIISLIPNVFLKGKFKIWEKRGYHILPVHFYSPIPDTRTLSESIWDRKTCEGINFNPEVQLMILNEICPLYKKEYDLFPKAPTNIPNQFYLNAGNLECVDAEILYSIIRNYKPKRIFEIGSGFSTYLSSEAIKKNELENQSWNCELIAIEPFPNRIIKNGFPGLSKLIEQRVETLDANIFTQLKENDILFIDSSHVSKIGSDVNFEFFEVLPKLNKGVFVHFHDIFLPFDYPKAWIQSRNRFWNEQYMLHAFLMFNERFKVVWASNYMKINYKDNISKQFNSFNENAQPGSFWIMRK